MDNSKPWYASTTLWAQVMAFAGVGLSAFGYQFSEGASADVLTAIGNTVAAVSGIWVVVGRFKAGNLYVKTPKA